jgi:hypothetical protein
MILAVLPVTNILFCDTVWVELNAFAIIILAVLPYTLIHDVAVLIVQNTLAVILAVLPFNNILFYTV